MYGFYLIVTRKLSSVDNPLLTLFLTGVVGATLGSFMMPLTWVYPTLNEWLIMFLIGLFASIGHFLLILSLKFADASKLAPFGYFEIIPNMLIGFYFFSHLPSYFDILGLMIIVLSGLYILKSERKI